MVERASSLANLGKGVGFLRFAKVLDLVCRVFEKNALQVKEVPSIKNKVPVQENKNPLLKNRNPSQEKSNPVRKNKSPLQESKVP